MREHTLKDNSIEALWNYIKHLNIAKCIDLIQTFLPIPLPLQNIKSSPPYLNCTAFNFCTYSLSVY